MKIWVKLKFFWETSKTQQNLGFNKIKVPRNFSQFIYLKNAELSRKSFNSPSSERAFLLPTSFHVSPANSFTIETFKRLPTNL